MTSNNRAGSCGSPELKQARSDDPCERVAAEGAPEDNSASDQATGQVQAGAYAPGSVSASQPSTDDDDPGNMFVRAGYLIGLAVQQTNEQHRELLLRASRSLVFAADLITTLQGRPEFQAVLSELRSETNG